MIQEEKQLPSPPSGLDGAADKYLDTQDVAEVFCGDYEGWQIVNAFKAGAEWMAKQGVSMEVVTGVPWRAVDAFIHDHDYTEDSIIQIRKK